MPADAVEAVKARGDVVDNQSIQLALHDILNTLANQDKEAKLMADKLDKVAYAIFGNGEPGLKERVNTHERQIGIAARFGWAAVAFVGTASTAVIGLVATAFWHLIAKAP